MLKKILSGVLILSVAATMLAVPAFADYHKGAETQTNIITEDFGSLTLDATTMQAQTQISNSSVWVRTNPYKTGNTTIEITDDKQLKMTFATQDYEMSNIWFKTGTKTAIDRDDVLHINFDTQITNDVGIDLILGDNFFSDDTAFSTETDVTRRFVSLPGSDASFDAANTDTYDVKHAIAFLSGDKGVQVGHQKAGGSTTFGGYVDNNVNVDIVINPYDDAQNGEQTIKQTYTYEKGDGTYETKVYYAKFDANYTGVDDNEFSKITEFNFLRFYAYYVTSDSGSYSIDNMNIEKITTEKKYYTAAVKTLIDYDFSDIPGYTFSGATDDTTMQVVDAENNVYFKQYTNTVSTAGVVQDAVKGYVFKQSLKPEDPTNPTNTMGNHLIFINPEGSTAIKEGDIIRFSYDMKNSPSETQTADFAYRVSPILNLPHYGSDSYGTGMTDYAEPNGYYVGTYDDEGAVSGTYAVYRDAMLLEQRATGDSRFTPRSRWSGTAVSQKADVNKWHNYEFVINTADKTKDGKQTMKVYIDKGTANELVLYETLDIDVTNDDKNVYDKFTALQMYFYGDTTVQEGDCIYTTNYKLDIITPGFGISGAAIENNDPTDGIKLEKGKTMKVTAGFNIPGSGMKTTGTGDNAMAKTKLTVYAAQYKDNVLKEVTPLTYEYTEADFVKDLDITVGSDIDTVKLFAFDQNLVPQFAATEGTVVTGAED